MRHINFTFVRAAGALIAGLILVIAPNEAGNYFVITIGALFMLPSLLNLAGYFLMKKEQRAFFPIDAIGGLLFGTMLMIMPGFFADFLTFVLGFFILMGAVQQMALLLAASNWVTVPWISYVLPFLIILAGVYAVASPSATRSTAFFIIGICCIVYGLSDFFNWFKYTRKRPTEPQQPESSSIANNNDDDDDGIEDAQIIG